jgi:hypothetical protein
MNDLHDNLKVSRAISPVSGAGDTTAQVSQIIDTQGYNSLEFLIATGTLSDVDATFTVLVEDGDVSTLSDNAAVVDAQLLGLESEASFIFSDDDKVKKIGYIGGKRYVRLTITPAANTGAWLIAAIAIQGHPTKAPVA